MHAWSTCTRCPRGGNNRSVIHCQRLKGPNSLCANSWEKKTVTLHSYYSFFLFILFQSKAENKQYIRIPAVELHTPTDIAEKNFHTLNPNLKIYHMIHDSQAKLKINPLNSHLLPFPVVQVLQKCGTFSVLFNLTPWPVSGEKANVTLSLCNLK